MQLEALPSPPASDPCALSFSAPLQRGTVLRSHSSREHPEADRKHPIAHPTQGLWATSLTRAPALLAYFHQTSEGLRGI